MFVQKQHIGHTPNECLRKGWYHGHTKVPSDCLCSLNLNLRHRNMRSTFKQISFYSFLIRSFEFCKTIRRSLLIKCSLFIKLRLKEVMRFGMERKSQYIPVQGQIPEINKHQERIYSMDPPNKKDRVTPVSQTNIHACYS